MEVKFLVKSAHTKYVKFIRDIKQNICSAIVKAFFHFFYSALLAKGESKQKGWLESIALSMQSLLRWYQFWRQIIFKREEAKLSCSLLHIICRQIWYQRQSDYMDRAYVSKYGKMFFKAPPQIIFGIYILSWFTISVTIKMTILFYLFDINSSKNVIKRKGFYTPLFNESAHSAVTVLQFCIVYGCRINYFRWSIFSTNGG